MARLLPGILLVMLILVSGCSESLDGSAIDVDQLCSRSSNAFAEQDFGDLLLDLERQLGVAKAKMRVTPEGIFVPMKERFVEEQGYFLARPGTDVNAKGTDPSFVLLKGCLYRYQIKG